MAKTSRSSVARDAVEALRRASLEAADGDLLGSEDELVSRLGISRPTLRQASALLVQEQLITVRRGVGGGYFARRPNSSAVAHMAAIYLLIHGASLEEIVRAVEPIRIELTRLAAQNDDPAIKQAMAVFIENERKLDVQGVEYRQFLKAEREFSELLGKGSQNRVLSLFLQILYDFASLLTRDQDIYINRPDRVETYRHSRNMMAEAVFAGDAEMATLAARRCSQSISEWLLEDISAQQNDKPPADFGPTLARAFANRGMDLADAKHLSEDGW